MDSNLGINQLIIKVERFTIEDQLERDSQERIRKTIEELWPRGWVRRDGWVSS